MSYIEIAQYDHYYVTIRLYEVNPTTKETIPFDLSGALSVYLYLTKYGESTPRISNTCDIVNAKSGICKTYFDSIDTSVVGDYYGEVEVIKTNQRISFGIETGYELKVKIIPSYRG